MESRSAGRTRLMKFWADWCMPCRFMTPVVEGVLKDSVYDDVELVSVNVDEEMGQEAAKKFCIKSIPTLVLLDDNDQVLSTLIGTASEDQVREFLSKR
jgi:thioredoxin 1